MKKRITDLMDDLPAEELDNILKQSGARKRRRLSSGMSKAAAAVAIIAVLGGVVTYAAYSESGFLKNRL